MTGQDDRHPDDSDSVDLSSLPAPTGVPVADELVTPRPADAPVGLEELPPPVVEAPSGLEELPPPVVGADAGPELEELPPPVVEASGLEELPPPVVEASGLEELPVDDPSPLPDTAVPVGDRPADGSAGDAGVTVDLASLRGDDTVDEATPDLATLAGVEAVPAPPVGGDDMPVPAAAPVLPPPVPAPDGPPTEQLAAVAPVDAPPVEHHAEERKRRPVVPILAAALIAVLAGLGTFFVLGRSDDDGPELVRAEPVSETTAAPGTTAAPTTSIPATTVATTAPPTTIDPEVLERERLETLAGTVRADAQVVTNVPSFPDQLEVGDLLEVLVQGATDPSITLTAEVVDPLGGRESIPFTDVLSVPLELPGAHTVGIIADVGGVETVNLGRFDVDVAESDALRVGTWISVYASTRTISEALDAAARISPEAAVLDTNEFASLSDDFFAAYEGPFDTPEEAQRRCFERGFTSTDRCFAAPISDDPADRQDRRPPSP